MATVDPGLDRPDKNHEWSYDSDSKLIHHTTSSWQLVQEDIAVGLGLAHLHSFATEAEAQAYSQAQGATPTPDTTVNAGPFSGLSDIGAVFGALGNGVADGKMWRSLGWLIGGLILMLVGIALWVKGSLNPLAAVR